MQLRAYTPSQKNYQATLNALLNERSLADSLFRKDHAYRIIHNKGAGDLTRWNLIKQSWKKPFHKIRQQTVVSFHFISMYGDGSKLDTLHYTTCVVYPCWLDQLISLDYLLLSWKHNQKQFKCPYIFHHSGEKIMGAWQIRYLWRLKDDHNYNGMDVVH